MRVTDTKFVILQRRNCFLESYRRYGWWHVHKCFIISHTFYLNFFITNVFQNKYKKHLILKRRLNKEEKSILKVDMKN